ncbi:MAG: ABC transporter permease [Lachnospiraceae bacterium]|nr:ABC transporter permease [Lachnospiraceae bacterium]
MDTLNTVIINGISFTLPLFIMAVGGIYSERSGITNLALEGLQGAGAFVGAIAAFIVAKQFGSGSPLTIAAALAFALLGGMAYSLLHAVLCIKFKADMVISGVVVNILAMAFTAFLTKSVNRTVFGSPSDKIDLGVLPRITVPGLSGVPVIGAFFTDVYPFVPVIIVLSVIFWFLLYKTPFGLHLRAAGDNPAAVDAAGVDVQMVRYISVIVSGALSGIAGICFAYSVSAKFSADIYMGYGYLSIAALIFGGWKIMPTLLACLIFGFARSAGYQIVQKLGLPSSYSDIVMILPYILTLLLLIVLAKNSQAPRALGEAYDKSKR